MTSSQCPCRRCQPKAPDMGFPFLTPNYLRELLQGGLCSQCGRGECPKARDHDCFCAGEAPQEEAA